jgi:hypothetical protein
LKRLILLLLPPTLSVLSISSYLRSAPFKALYSASRSGSGIRTIGVGVMWVGVMEVEVEVMGVGVVVSRLRMDDIAIWDMSPGDYDAPVRYKWLEL